MRTIEAVQGFTVKYPDEVGFAFNPCLFIFEGSGLAWVRVRIFAEDTLIATVEEKAFGDKLYFDLREYIQTAFDTMSFGTLDYTKVTKTELGKMFKFSFAYATSSDSDENMEFKGEDYVEGDSDSTQEYLKVFYIWGALKIGGQETYNGYRTLKWFRGYPFSFGLFSLGGSLLFCRDGVATRFENTDGEGVYNIPLLSTDDCKLYYTIMDCTGAFVEVTFDKTFDMTFRYTGGGTKTEKVRVEVEDGYDEGYYLRWIDRHGFYCYYLFKAGEESRKTTADESFSRNNLLAYDMSYGYEGYTGRQQQMSREDTVPVCAPNVDSETYDMLFDLATSPCVDLFAGYDDAGDPKWIAVTIQAGTYKKSTAVLQDFTCNVVMPEVPIQKL